MKLTIVILCFVSLSSCKKYLDQKPSKDLVIPTRLADLQALMDNNGIMNLNTPVLGQVGTDEYYLRESDWENMNNRSRNAYVWGKDIYDDAALNDWGYAYRPVYFANIALEKLNTVERTIQNNSEWDQVRGTALFFRARFFQSAAFIWSKAYDDNTAKADLGIPLRMSSDFNEKSNRSSVEETYAAIISDLAEAARLLPTRADHVMRPSKLASWSLLARTYLSMRQYDSCFKYADLVLKEYPDLLDYNSISAAPAYPFARFNSEVLFHSRNFNSYSPPLYVYARVDSSLYSSYSNNDLRKSLYFKSNTDGTHYFRGSYDNSFQFFNGITSSEVYLMRAECYARRDALDSALQDLNFLLRKRWKVGTFTSISTNSANELLAIILNERKKELIFRDLRWMDIKRLNKEGSKIVLRRFLNNKIEELSPNDNRFAWPVPDDIIGMTGMQQNPR